MLFETDTQIDIRERSPLALAFLGDGVFELLVRQRVIENSLQPIQKLHATAVGYVSARHQAVGLQAILPMLSEQEAAVVRRGRNAQKASVSKNATREEYAASTALEALFGWLFLQNQQERIRQLFDTVWSSLQQAYQAQQSGGERSCTASK